MQAEALKGAFETQRAMMALAAKCKKPSGAEMQDAVKATAEFIGQVQSKATTDRRHPGYNHLQALSEAVPALRWVMVEKTPGPHINDMWDCGAFNQTKILTEFKGKSEDHVAFAKAMKQIFVDLGAYEELFAFACPKFISPAPPPYDNLPANYNPQEAYRLQLRLFMVRARRG